MKGRWSVHTSRSFSFEGLEGEEGETEFFRFWLPAFFYAVRKVAHGDFVQLRRQ